MVQVRKALLEVRLMDFLKLKVYCPCSNVTDTITFIGRLIHLIV